ncbi:MULTISPECIES: N-acyl-D-amino-acid deacylase family protein [Phenylobacterium]|uniref:N-acyl-D-aspartate/D-glutamate deacylase n=1 Tax=Phenylobacterium koreense TaxID=266125 RepID=A0ABV2EKB2_9CAUL
MFITKAVAATSVVALLASVSPAQAQQAMDVLIKGGVVYDGGAGAGVVADVGVKDGKIAFVGDAAKDRVTAATTIEARGRIVSPGFIDPHTHYFEDLTSPDPAVRRNLGAAMQGVTTVFVGSDGGDGGGGPDVKATFDRMEALGFGTNTATWVGFGDVRSRVLGESDRAPTAAELEAMKGMVASAMCQGALGLSTGLFYPPQSYAKTAEVIELAKEAAKRGGRYDSHIRDESTYTIGLKGAVQEVFDIGQAANIPVNISHIKALGVDVQGQSGEVIAMVEAARAAGLQVSADQYPWLASGSSVADALLPRWAQADGGEATLRRLADPALGPKIRAEMAENLRRRGGALSILLTAGPVKAVLGKTLDEVAAEWKVDPIEAAVRILLQGGSHIASFNQSEADVKAFMRQPWVMTSSDGSEGHPRKYASFAEKYAKYVKAEKAISLSDFIHRSTGLTADTFGLTGRGYLRRGYVADVVVLDPQTYGPKATYVQPELLSVGAEQVLVNGRFVVRDGEPTGELAGKRVLHSPASCD